MESDDVRPGYYKDHHGVWHRDRRVSTDRRKVGGAAAHHHDRRANFGRRKADQDITDRDHREAIREALEEFEEEHGQSAL